MEQCSYFLTNQAHHLRALDDPNPAESLQTRSKPRQNCGVHCMRAGVQRHSHVAFRRGDEVHRQTQLTKASERVGQKADLVPHAQGLHRHHGDRRST